MAELTHCGECQQEIARSDLFCSQCGADNRRPENRWLIKPHLHRSTTGNHCVLCGIDIGESNSDIRRFDCRCTWFLALFGAFLAALGVVIWFVAAPANRSSPIIAGLLMLWYVAAILKYKNAYYEIWKDRLVIVNPLGSEETVRFSDLEDFVGIARRGASGVILRRKNGEYVSMSKPINKEREFWEVLRDRTGLELRRNFFGLKS